MRLDYDNTRTKTNQKVDGAKEIEKRSPLSLFEEFYQIQNNQAMDQNQTKFLENIIDEVWGNANETN